MAPAARADDKGVGRWLGAVFGHDSPLRTMLPYWRQERRSVALGLACITLSVLFNVQIPILCREIAEGALSPNGVPPPVSLLVTKTLVVMAYFAAYHSLSMAGHYFADYTAACVSSRVLGEALQATYGLTWEEAMAAPPTQVASEISTAARFATEITCGAFTNLYQSIIYSIGFGAMLLQISTSMCVVLVCVVAASRVLSNKLRNFLSLSALSSEQTTLDGTVAQLLTSALHRCATIKVYPRARPLLGTAFDGCLRRSNAIRSQLAFGIHANSALTSCSTNWMYVTLIAISRYLRDSGEMQIGDVVIFFFYIKRLLDQVSDIINEGAKFQVEAGRTAALRNLKAKAQRHAVEGTTEQHLLLGAGRVSSTQRHGAAEGALVVVEGLHVRYGRGPDRVAALADPTTTADADSSSDTVEALRGVSLRVPAGQLTCIVGRSGSGKTTLLRVLCGLVPPTSGTCSLHEAVRGVALLEQTPALLPGTIHDNIAIGRWDAPGTPSAHRAAVVAAARKASALDFIDALPNGFDTYIASPDDAPLSGGQQQRLCLARVFFSNADLVLFDEPTTGLDATNSAAVLHDMDRLWREEGRTVVMVTHQTHHTQSAANVVTLDGGKVV